MKHRQEVYGRIEDLQDHKTATSLGRSSRTQGWWGIQERPHNVVPLPDSSDSDSDSRGAETAASEKEGGYTLATPVIAGDEANGPGVCPYRESMEQSLLWTGEAQRNSAARRLDADLDAAATSGASSCSRSSPVRPGHARPSVSTSVSVSVSASVAGSARHAPRNLWSVGGRLVLLVLLVSAGFVQRAAFAHVSRAAGRWWVSASLMSHAALSLCAALLCLLAALPSLMQPQQVVFFSLPYEAPRLKGPSSWNLFGAPACVGILDALGLTLLFPMAAYVPGSLQQVLLQTCVIFMNVSATYIMKPGSRVSATQHKVGTFLLLIATIILFFGVVSMGDNYDEVEREESLFFYCLLFALAGIPLAISNTMKTKYKPGKSPNYFLYHSISSFFRGIFIAIFSISAFLPGFGSFDTQDFKNMIPDGFDCMVNGSSSNATDCDDDLWKYLLVYVLSIIGYDIVQALLLKIKDGVDLMVLSSTIVVPASVLFFGCDEFAFIGESESQFWLHYLLAGMVFMALVHVHLGLILETTTFGYLGDSFWTHKFDWEILLRKAVLGNTPVVYPIFDNADEARMYLTYMHPMLEA